MQVHYYDCMILQWLCVHVRESNMLACPGKLALHACNPVLRVHGNVFACTACVRVRAHLALVAVGGRAMVRLHTSTRT